MAAPSSTVWGSIVKGSGNPGGRQGKLGIYTDISSTATQTTVKVDVWFWTIYSCLDGGPGYDNTVYYNVGTNTTSATTAVAESVLIDHEIATGSGWNTANQTKIYSKTHTYTRGTSATTYKIYAKFSGIDMLDSAVSVNTSFTVPALPTYTVKYDANGGTGAPSSQTKWHGIGLTITSTKPTRTGYTFKGWALTSTGTVYYTPGSTCGRNENLTLYAVWEAYTYAVKYDANGGTGAPGNQTKTYGVTLKLSSTIPTRTNYTFKGWGTSATATTVAYAAGANYTTNAGITLYAIWELNYVKPRIANLSVNRCLQDGTASDDGTYMRIKLDWSCDRNISKIEVQWSASSTEKKSATFTPSGTSGSVNEIISGPFNTEKTYTIDIFVHDTVNYSPASTILHGKKFTIDLLAGGNGVAFGKAAEREGWADFGFHAVFNGSVRGNVLGLGTSNQLESGVDFNAYLTPGVYGVGSHSIAGSIANNPAGAQAGRLIVCSATGGGYGVGDWTYLQQWYIPMTFTASTQNAIYVRTITREPNKAPNYYQWLKFTAVSA